jgi:hypothetical protein
VVSFTIHLLYYWGKSPRYLFDRLSGPQSSCGRGSEEKNLYVYRKSNTGHPASYLSQYTDGATPYLNRENENVWI